MFNKVLLPMLFLYSCLPKALNFRLKKSFFDILVIIWYNHHYHCTMCSLGTMFSVQPYNRKILKSTGCFFLTVPPHFQNQNEKTFSANEELFYIENDVKKKSWFASIWFSFWYWKSGGTVKKSIPYMSCIDVSKKNRYNLFANV